LKIEENLILQQRKCVWARACGCSLIGMRSL
jgi:hypothetical protein